MKPVREGLFTSTGLIGSRCSSCGRHDFPSRDTCPYCGSEDVAEVELSSAGALWAWTAVTATPPGYVGEVPYGFGVVELPEGIRVLTRLTEPDPAQLTLGQAMRFELVELGDVTTYAFAP